MALTAEKQILDINQLYRLKNGAIGCPSDLYYGSTRIMQACIKRNNKIIKVYNIADYYLSIPEGILVEPSGVEPTIDYDSYKIDYDGTREDDLSVTITFDPELAPNMEDGKIINGTFKVELIISGLTLTGNYSQNGSSGYYEYYNISAYSATYPRIPASGSKSSTSDGWIPITVSYSYVERLVKPDGTFEDTTMYGTTTSCRIITYNNGDYNSHAQINTNTGKVYADSLYDNYYSSEITLFTIKQLEIDITLDKTYTLPLILDIPCVQQENISKTTTTYAIASCVADPSTVFAIGGNIKVTVDATKTTKTVWTSKYEEDPTTTMDYATVESSVCTFPYGNTINSEKYVTATVPEWESTTSRTFTFTAYSSDGSVSKVSNTVTQQANSVEYKWGKPIITGVYCANDIPANGGIGVVITASYTQTQYKISQTEGAVVYDTDEGTIVVDSASGNPLLNNARVSGAVVYADPWGAEDKNRQPVFTVTSVTLTANGVTSDASSGLTCSVYQAKNEVVSTSTTYYLELSASGTPVAAIGGSATISVSAKYTDTDTYTSDAQATSDKLDATASLSTTGGTLGASSLKGNNSTTLSFGENYDEQSYSYTVTARCGDKEKTVSVSQSAAKYEFEITSLTPSIGADGGSVSLSVTSKRNGKEQSFTTDNVSISGLSDVTKSVTNHGGGSFSVILGVLPNEETEDRSFTVSLTQPFSGRTASTTVTQSGAVDDRDDVFIRLMASASSDYATVSYSVQFQATNVTLYQGGKLNNVYVRLGTEDGSELVAEKLLANQIVVAEGSSSSTYTGELSNRLGSDVWIHVFYNNAIQKSMRPVIEMT